jgi:hypothetical protein
MISLYSRYANVSCTRTKHTHTHTGIPSYDPGGWIQEGADGGAGEGWGGAKEEGHVHSPRAVTFELRKEGRGRKDGKEDKGLPYKLNAPCGLSFTPQGNLLVADRCVFRLMRVHTKCLKANISDRLKFKKDVWSFIGWQYLSPILCLWKPTVSYKLP